MFYDKLETSDSVLWCDHSIQLSSLALRLVYDRTWVIFFLWKDAHKFFGCFLWHICSTFQPGHTVYRSESPVIFEFAIPALKVVSSRLHETPFDLKKKNPLYFKEFCYTSQSRVHLVPVYIFLSSVNFKPTTVLLSLLNWYPFFSDDLDYEKKKSWNLLTLQLAAAFLFSLPLTLEKIVKTQLNK